MDHIDHARLIKLYNDQSLSVDKLPYTPEIDALVNTYNHLKSHKITHLQCYRALINLRKNGKLVTRNKRAVQRKATV